jgi:hypothetical protein
MNRPQTSARISRLPLLCIGAILAVIGGGGAAVAQPHVMHGDAPNTHNMLVFGEKKIYLSHLPMFDGMNSEKTEFTSPHRYQVILEASFVNGTQNLMSVYLNDRRQHPNVRIYTLNPAVFVLPKLVSNSPQTPPLSAFKATIFRGHLEKGGQPIGGLTGTNVHVDRVIHFRKFNPTPNQPAVLKYLLFGIAQELFLAHYITRPPDFDQVLSVAVTGHAFTDAELSKGIEITIPGKQNQVGERLKEAQQVAGQQQTANPAQPLTFTLKVNKEIYFEQGELLIPPNFDDTLAEKAKK